MKKILVTGSTGPQGKAAIHSLLNAVIWDVAGSSVPAFEIIAITRNVKSPAAQELKQTGGERLELFECNLDNREAIKAVFDEIERRDERVYGVFCVLASAGLDKDTRGEENQGKALINCAIAHGVEHFVYSSIERAAETEDDQFPLNSSAKVMVERYLKSKTGSTAVEEPSSHELNSEPLSSMRWTILRPAFFMLNFIGPTGKMTTGILREGLKHETAVQLVAMEDMGNTVRVVFENPGLYASQGFTVASQSLTADERDKAYSRAVAPLTKGTNQPATTPHKRMPSTPGILARSLIRWNRPAREMCEDLEGIYASHVKNGKGNPVANLETVRKALGPYGMMNFEEFCSRNFPGGRLCRVNTIEQRQQMAKADRRWSNISTLGLFRGKAETVG
ncbi:NAD(P)-binding protein [Serendipita vermifera]|nr:NAD(P)-binding protein [Serendipita vermifera]